MKRWGLLLAAACLTFNGDAAVLYVDANGANPVAPYADWSTAATNIQDAVDASVAGDVILVTNGIYQIGGRLISGGSLTNRLVVDKAVTVESVNGPRATAIAGYQVPGTTNGPSAVRCAYLMNGAQLSGFTIENGATLQLNNVTTNAEANGGGIWCDSSGVIVSNCVVVSNSCSVYGAGIYSGTVQGCDVSWNAIQSSGSFGAGAVACSVVTGSTIASNYFVGTVGEAGAGAFSCVLSNCVINANLKGGVAGCTLESCRVVNNANSSTIYNGGGAAQSILDSCTVSGNQSAANGGGAYDCVLNTCIVSGNSAAGSGGGVYSDNFQTNAPGQNNVLSRNTSGDSGGGLYLAPGVSSTNWPIIAWTFSNNSSARDGGGLYLTSLRSVVDYCTFVGNTAAGNGGGFCPSSGASPLFGIVGSTFDSNVAGGNGGGGYEVALNNCLVTGNQAANGGGVYGWASNSVFNGNTAATNGGGLYVWGSTAVVPNCQFTNNIAVNGGAGCLGAFTNCVFSANRAATNGGGLCSAALSDCLVVSNQAGFGGGAFIGGTSIPNYPGTQVSYIRCKFIGNLANLDGAGIYFSGAGFGTNCWFQSNSALGNGGGIFGGNFGGSQLWNNNALNGGAAYNAAITKSFIFGNTAAANGGGTYGGSISYCSLSNNVAQTNGGGSYSSTLSDCLETGNSAAYGGGAYLGSLGNSTIAGNSATTAGGGTYTATASSCIIYDNSAPTGSNYSSFNSVGYSCTAPLPPVGTGNIADDPAFVDLASGNFRLQTNSPCINVGSGAPGNVDLDGRNRYVGPIDIGAYEFQAPGVGEFTAWLQQYGLATDGSADYADTDGDKMNNWQEWIAGTDPTSSASVLKMMKPIFTNSATAINITWQSVSNRTYFLQRSHSLSAQPPFSTIQSNIVGQTGITGYTDTNGAGAAPLFYRVGIQ